MARHRPKPRKLLVASIGVATLNYLPAACAGSSVANLMAPPDGLLNTGGSSTGGNGYGGNAIRDAGRDVDAAPMPSPTVANLLAPAPQSQSLPANKKGR